MSEFINPYELTLIQFLNDVPETKLAIVIDKNGNMIAGAYPEDIEDRVESLTIFSAILNFSNQKLIDLMFLGEVQQCYLRGSEGYFLYQRIDIERILIVKTSRDARLGLINLDIMRMSENFRKIPYQIIVNSDTLESKLNNIEEEFRQNNKIFFNYAIVEKDHYRLKNLIDIAKGQLLETDSRKAFRREYHYRISDSGKNWKINRRQIDYLIKENCQKDPNTKSIEIDIFGEKDLNDRKIYILGECKNRVKPISENEMKCFIIKASIIANHLMRYHELQTQNMPLFHLVVISLKGFARKNIIKSLFRKYWKLPKNRALKGSIDLIDKDPYIKLLKKNNISSKFYEEL